MGYESIDKLQNILANDVFNYASDKKKAAGRAIGTFIEIITFYLIKTWGLEEYIAIEHPLPEFANNIIRHNVEFTLHGSKLLIEDSFSPNDYPLSLSKLKKKHLSLNLLNNKSIMLVDKDNVIRNACTLYVNDNFIINAYINTKIQTYRINKLFNKPFAMFECKRVGVEEGIKKGPTTIEKAKQGSYVARTVSALQRIRLNDGSLGGLLQKKDNSFIIDQYYRLLNQIILSDDSSLLANFILTCGVVSNHGNWFTSDNANKELLVLAQSYDWLLFLTDQGISKFITDLLIEDNPKFEPIKSAFRLSYQKDKKRNIFTKIKMDYNCDKALCLYFKENIKEIESWFNVITPNDKILAHLKTELRALSKKNWQVIYGN
ncbi:MAG: hypothetical protein ACTTKH_00055 [Treponema sp.]